MPELPEVETTVNGLKAKIVNLVIKDVWTSYNSPYFKGSETIKDPVYFKYFKKTVIGQKITSVERRAKNILINLNNGQTILIHMKMTGHLLYGLYKFNAKNKNDPWEPISPESLKDPFNRRVRFLLTFNNDKHLALSDTRKFAKVTLAKTAEIHTSIHLKDLGPEPLDKSFTLEVFLDVLKSKARTKIKQALTDQTVLSGIGNIYADESLWRASIHPAKIVSTIQRVRLKELFKAIKETLSKGINLGGDSMSDYRNVDGDRGKFQEKHMAYQKTGEKCGKRGCKGIITRIVLGGRATHYCDHHQRLE
ncbi:MAG: bifunctional DNA-formamidopyrimidine glycosylase/DNA-(apurinic or apyrimidinic site) lyase [Candidatus Paceibacterota bacterium]|jgi:formamidopyrimidine-DNA glycosylase